MAAMRLSLCISLFAVVLTPVLCSAPARDKAIGPWSGGVTEDSAIVKALLTKGGSDAVLALESGLGRSVAARTDDAGVVAFPLQGLKPNTVYKYTIKETGNNSLLEGAFRTFPINGKAASFQFAFGSCTATGSTSTVFETIQATLPLFFINTGDLHYEDIAVNDPKRFREALTRVFSSPTQSALFRSVPLVYIWDDHDYGPNDSDANAPGRSAARSVYQEFIPHYPLAAGSGDVPIYQSFQVGRALFLITDLRSERTPASHPDGAEKSMMGKVQKDWFKRQLLDAKKSSAVIFFVSSVPWIGQPSGGDSWSAYPTERAEIANFVKEHGIKNLIILAGDAHMLAADDGSNSDYADGGGARIPVLHAGPLDRGYSLKGGPYSEGVYLAKKGEGCFGFVEVEDRREQGVTVIYSGRNLRGETKLRLTLNLPSQ